MLNAEDVGVLCAEPIEDLAMIAAISPWSEETIYLPGLRAVLASGRCRTRAQAKHRRSRCGCPIETITQHLTARGWTE